MELLGNTLKTNIYIQSEAEFSHARTRSGWKRLLDAVLHRSPHLLDLHTIVPKPSAAPARPLGLRDVDLEHIAGSVGRSRDFTRTFAPRFDDGENKERWRAVYSLIVTGRGIPPVSLLKVGNDYFVEDGHHRISVAHHLGWQTIQANVTELVLPDTQPQALEPNTCREPALCC